MTDYEPLDLSAYCNAGKEALNLSDPRLGDQSGAACRSEWPKIRNVVALHPRQRQSASTSAGRPGT